MLSGVGMAHGSRMCLSEGGGVLKTKRTGVPARPQRLIGGGKPSAQALPTPMHRSKRTGHGAC